MSKQIIIENICNSPIHEVYDAHGNCTCDEEAWIIQLHKNTDDKTMEIVKVILEDIINQAKKSNRDIIHYISITKDGIDNAKKLLKERCSNQKHTITF